MVTDGAGNPLANVPLLCSNRMDPQQVATTGADGSYEFDRLALDTYALSVGQVPGIDRQQVVISASRARPDSQLLSLAVKLSGTVVASDGAMRVRRRLGPLEQGNSSLVTTEPDSTWRTTSLRRSEPVLTPSPPAGRPAQPPRRQSRSAYRT